MSTKTIKVPKELFRSGMATMDAETKVIRLSISSDEPYLRYDYWDDEEYYEVLDHSAEGADLSRLKKGAALLYNHDRNVMLGTLSAPTLENGRCYVDAKISAAPDVESFRMKIEEGILKDTSIGYAITDEGECIGAKDGKPIYKFKFAVHEASMVTIPADTSVGIGRQRDNKPDGEPKEITIRDEKGLAKTDNKAQTQSQPTNTTMKIKSAPKFLEAEKDAGGAGAIDVVRERETAASEALLGFEAKCDKIDLWIKNLPKEGWRTEAAAVAATYKKVSDKRSFDEFRTEALSKCEALALTTPQDNTELGLSRKERGAFSVRKAIYEIAMTKRGVAGFKGLTGHELAVCTAAEKMYGEGDERQFVGLCIPDDITNGRFDEDHDLDSTGMRNLAETVRRVERKLNAQVASRALNASVFTAGGALVGSDLLGGSMIDILRNAVLIGNGALGITELGGLMGNIAIPKQTGTSQVYWLAEGAAITQSQESFAQLVLTPKRNGVATQYTKQLLAQSSVGVEAFVRSDQMLTLAVEEDRVAINGTGASGEPIGILNTTGVLANVTFGGAAVWADIIALEYGLENANVRTGQMAVLTSPLTKSYLKQTLVVAASTFPIFIWGKNEGWPTLNGVMPGVINDYPAYATKNVTSNVMIQGVFRNFIKARWAGFDVVVDPYTGALSELINIIVNSWMDQALRYPQSFNATTDAPSAP